MNPRSLSSWGVPSGPPRPPNASRDDWLTAGPIIPQLSESAIQLFGVTKAFAGHVAVRDLSLAIPRGSVFGLLGPNGAGKTTTLRMVMDILGADAGTIEILGRPLYPRMVVEEQLVFFATLKGVSRSEALRRVGPWLERVGLADCRKRKLNELSKGMQQKVQFVATVLPDPEILILDEPMNGLDPVAADAMRQTLLDLSRQGKTLVLSSHQMETVERLCDSIALIDRGRKLLDGPVREVKARHGKNTVVLAFDGDGAFLAGLAGVQKVTDFGRYVEIRLAEGSDPQSILREAAARLRLSRFEIVEPSLHDIFVEEVTAHGVAAA